RYSAARRWRGRSRRARSNLTPEVGAKPLVGLKLVEPSHAGFHLLGGEGFCSHGGQNFETHNIPPGAVEKVAARRVYPVMAPVDYQGRSAGAPVKGPRGLIVSIAECEPGNRPGLHRHLNTVENFFCLSGRFEIAWGDQGEHTLVLEPLDMISVPRGENRSFRNISNGFGRLLVMIVPETDEQIDSISYSSSLAKEIEKEYGKTALDGLQRIGFVFEDEPTG